ncbi:TAXI family TRAP transporter solute-binding subunit [Micromonospora sp. CPCC 205371]|nr:TAXI family TRAP transporter solute-binding subunit [Micromonospora sp. CPCC 205371]
MRRASAAVAVLLFLGTPSACDAAPDAALDGVTIAAGAPGDVYHALGQALAGAAGGMKVLETGGSLDNLRLVAEGGADAGFATVDTVTMATHGDQPFRAAGALVALARLYDDYLQIVVPADSDIDRITDLPGRRVSTGPDGSGNAVVANRVLGTDMETVHLSPADSADALHAGQIDAFVVTGGLPVPAVQELSERRPIRLLSLRTEIADIQSQYGEQYQARTIPARTYGMPTEVETLGVANVLVVRPDLPGDIAYQLTSLLFDAKADLVRAHAEARRLDHRQAPATFPIPLHTAASRYYRTHKTFA